MGVQSPTVQAFVDYATIIFKYLGKNCDLWSTINEPDAFCTFGNIEGGYPPGMDYYISGSDAAKWRFVCGHNVLVAHGMAVSAFRKLRDTENTLSSNAKIALGIASVWNEPMNRDLASISAAQRALEEQLGWFAGPIYSGDYPKVLRYLWYKNGFVPFQYHASLPLFTDEELNHVKGSNDYFGLIHYNTHFQTVSNDSAAAPLMVGNADSAVIGNTSNITFTAGGSAPNFFCDSSK